MVKVTVGQEDPRQIPQVNTLGREAPECAGAHVNEPRPRRGPTEMAGGGSMGVGHGGTGPEHDPGGPLDHCLGFSGSE